MFIVSAFCLKRRFFLPVSSARPPNKASPGSFYKQLTKGLWLFEIKQIMKVEKRIAKPTKNYRATYRKLDSRNNTLLELDSIQERLNNRISELSVGMRTSKRPRSHRAIDQMNVLKLYRTQVEYITTTLKAHSEESWRQLLPEIEIIFNRAEQLLVYHP